MELEENNLAFIDGQNMHFGTTKCNACSLALDIDIQSIKLSDCKCGTAWRVDLLRFRVYLREKYQVSEAYYFLGNVQDENDELYKEVQKAGFIVVFKNHNRLAKSKKKGNIDTDLVFEIMRNLVDNNLFNKIVLVSGDGDYKKLVDYLIIKNRFLKIFFSNRKFASSLYFNLGSEYYEHLENLKDKISFGSGEVPK